ncbi:MAG: response regulator, partial [Nitrospirota bacterium]|nr:response regulator [Nitrospirota bacterium]
DVAAAASVDEAFQTLKAAGRGPDLVISDYRLGETATGIDALERIRSQYGREIPGVLLTGDTSLRRLVRLGSERGFLVLHKPVAPAELAAALESGLSGRQPADDR